MNREEAIKLFWELNPDLDGWDPIADNIDVIIKFAKYCSVGRMWR